jgi:hypothetical protein
MTAIAAVRKNLLPYGLFVALLSVLVAGVFWVAGDDAKLPVELRVWQFFAVFAAMLLVNLVVLSVLIAILRWKSVVQNGMMAIIPSQVVESSDATLQITRAGFGEITKHLKNTGDSVQILKHELKLKEDELAQAKNGAAQAEKEKVTNKLAKVHSFLRKLETEVAENRMEASAAIRFLNDELEDLFEEFGLYELKVAVGANLSDLESDSYAVKSHEITADQNENNTVAVVVEQGYGATRTNGTRRIVKPSVVIVKKLGE